MPIWGWPHCCKGGSDSQHHRRSTDAYRVRVDDPWSCNGSFKLHVFHKNNEIAGKLLGAACRVYRRFVGHLRSPVAGCCYRLWRHRGRRGDCVERAGIHPARIVHFGSDANSLGGSPVSFAFTQEGRVPLAGYLAQRDIIVNCVLQDANGSLTFAVRPNGNGFQLGAAPPGLSGRRLPSGRTSTC